MRVDISNKFKIGFLIVIASVVVVNQVVPSLGIVAEWQEFFAIGCALVVGLVIGGVFSRAFAANIRRLKAAGERLGQGDLAGEIDEALADKQAPAPAKRAPAAPGRGRAAAAGSPACVIPVSAGAGAPPSPPLTQPL